jgi:colicin import membrane protein
MRAILILIVAAILGFFGYQYAANGKGPGDAISALTGNANEMADGAATAASDAADTAAEAATDMADEATAAAEEAAAAAVAEVEAAAATAAAEAAAAGAAAAEAAAAEAAAAEAAAAEAAAAEVAAAEAAAADAAAAEAAAAAPEGMAALLTPEGFDADKVAEMINGSELSAVQKTVLTGAVSAVKENPALLEATLARIKEAMGM